MEGLFLGMEPLPEKVSSGKVISHKALSAKEQSGEIFSGEVPTAGRPVSGELSGKPASADNAVSYTHLTLPTNREV